MESRPVEIMRWRGTQRTTDRYGLIGQSLIQEPDVEGASTARQEIVVLMQNITLSSIMCCLLIEMLFVYPWLIIYIYKL